MELFLEQRGTAAESSLENATRSPFDRHSHLSTFNFSFALSSVPFKGDPFGGLTNGSVATAAGPRWYENEEEVVEWANIFLAMKNVRNNFAGGSLK